MDDVELVEDAEHDVTTPPDGAPASPTAAQRRRRRRARWAAAVAGVGLALAAGTTQLVLDARERARVARFADVPGVLAPLSEDLDVLWRSDEVAGVALSTPVDDLLVLATQDGPVLSLESLDADSGDPVWSVPVLDVGDDADTTAASDAYATCATDTVVAEPTTLTCVARAVVGRVEVPVDGGTWFSVLTHSVVLHVEQATGTVLDSVDLGTRTTATPSPDGWTATTPSIPLEDLDRDTARVPCTVDVEVRTWAGPEPAWTFETSPIEDCLAGSVVSTIEDGGAFAVTWRGHVTLLDRSTGAVVDELTDPDASSASVRLVGGTAAVTWLADGGSRTTLRTADGGRHDLPPTTRLIAPTVDDGSVPGLLLASVPSGAGHGDLARIDPADGTVLWESTVTSTEVQVLDGTLLGSGAGGLAAVDPATGTVRWLRTGVLDGTTSTDGVLLLTVGVGGIDAYRVVDGEPVWSLAVTDGPEGVGVIPTVDESADARTVQLPTAPEELWVTTVGRHLALVEADRTVTVLG